MKFGSRAEKFKEELEENWLALIRRYPCGSNEKEMCRISKPVTNKHSNAPNIGSSGTF